jgi:hypothetical protein
LDEDPRVADREGLTLTAVAYKIAPASIAAYYPEASVLVALDRCDVKSGTASYKSTPVLVSASSA